jgi:hypothetical protein
MPGLRRPHTKHTSASAFVSLPQEGQRIDPEVLRNIALVRGDAVALVEPHAEVDEVAREGTEWSVRVLAVDRLVVHPSLNPTSARKACQLGYLAPMRGRFSLTLVEGVA